MGYIEHNVIVEKSRQGRRVYSIAGYGVGKRELLAGDIYMDPETHMLMRYKGRPTVHSQRAA